LARKQVCLKGAAAERPDFPAGPEGLTAGGGSWDYRNNKAGRN
jgi:hypothetical protein